jgi:hypothetical protein
MPGDDENHRNISHHGIKTSQGHGARGMHDLHSVGCAEMPDGILGAPLNADPHRAGFKMPVHIAPETRRPVGEPREMAGPHNQGPHDHLHPAPHELASKARR